MENNATAETKAITEDEEVKKKDPLTVVARKPFVLNSIEPSKDKQKELAVFTSAKKLAEYIYKVTQNAPVKFRWSLVTRMHDTCADIVENLYLANFERGAKRLEYQKLASVKMRLLNHYAEVCYAVKVFPFKRLRLITEYITYARKLLAGWAKNTMKRDEIDGALPPALTIDTPKNRKIKAKGPQQLKLEI